MFSTRAHSLFELPRKILDLDFAKLTKRFERIGWRQAQVLIDEPVCLSVAQDNCTDSVSCRVGDSFHEIDCAYFVRAPQAANDTS